MKGGEGCSRLTRLHRAIETSNWTRKNVAQWREWRKRAFEAGK